MFLTWANFIKSDKIRRVLATKSLALAENRLNSQEKASFVLILTKPVELIFQFSAMQPKREHWYLLSAIIEETEDCI